MKPSISSTIPALPKIPIGQVNPLPHRNQCASLTPAAQRGASMSVRPSGRRANAVPL